MVSFKSPTTACRPRTVPLPVKFLGDDNSGNCGSCTSVTIQLYLAFGAGAAMDTWVSVPVVEKRKKPVPPVTVKLLLIFS